MMFDFSATRLLGLLLVGLLAGPFCRAYAAPPDVLPGVEVLIKRHAEKLNGKRVAILTNPTGVDRKLNHTIDLVRAIPGVKVVKLFAPEHGLRGGYRAGADVEDQSDPVTKLPIISLHGKTRRPTPAMLKDLDIVIYDIQDIGSRSYTFVSTLAYMMEECEEAGVAVWVLDRPDPLGGDKVGGPMIDDDNLSFIGVHNVPQVYGLTPGEFALLIKRERTPKIDLTIVPMDGWARGVTYGELGWPWVPPSEHVPRWETSFFYAILGTIGELNGINIGVGTPLPFEQIGAPWMDGVQLARTMSDFKLPGVIFRPTTFKPRYASFSGKFCQGVQIHLNNPATCNPAMVGMKFCEALSRLYPDRKLFARREGEDRALFVKAMGDDEILGLLAAGGPFKRVDEKIAADLAGYLKRREPILIYKPAAR